MQSNTSNKISETCHIRITKKTTNANVRILNLKLGRIDPNGGYGNLSDAMQTSAKKTKHIIEYMVEFQIPHCL